MRLILTVVASTIELPYLSSVYIDRNNPDLHTFEKNFEKTRNIKMSDVNINSNSFVNHETGVIGATGKAFWFI